MTKRAIFIGEHSIIGDHPSAYYRCIMPVKGLNQTGEWHARFTNTLVQGYNDKLSGWLGPSPLPTPDVIVCRRLLAADGTPQSAAPMFHKARDKGQTVLYDLDDDLWHIPEWNPAARQMTLAHKIACEKDLQAVSGVICSTPELETVVREHTDRPTFVCRNGIDLDDYPLVTGQEPHERLRVGWMGLTSYRGHDLAMIAEPLGEALQRNDCEFWHLGYRQDQPPVSEFLRDWPDSVPVVERPWTTIKHLSRRLAEIDVLVIPEQPSQFANSRSAITGLAALAAMVPYVASCLPEYHRVWRQGGGYVMNDDHWPGLEDWSEGLNVMTSLAYTDARREMGSFGRAMIAQRFNLERTTAQWLRVFDAFS